MDKNRMADDKKITFSAPTPDVQIHRLVGKMPPLMRDYGFWIINAALECVSGPGGYRSPWRSFEFYSLSHLIGGAGRFQLHGEERFTELKPGDAVLIAPGDLNRYGGTDEEPYIEDAIRFCGPAADMMRAAGILRSGVLHPGTVRKIPPIAELIQDPSGDAQFQANILLQKLLVDLYLEQRRHHAATPMEALIELLKSRPDHWWTVEEMAESCKLSTDQLRRNFRRHTGMLPKAYLEELKLRQAAELLLSTRLPVAEIAARFGYLDPYHFSRRFKHFSGLPPERYRRESPGAIHFPGGGGVRSH